LANFHIGDIGTILEITLLNGNTPANLSEATILQLRLLKPRSTDYIVRKAVFVTDGTDGKLRYIWQEGDLDITGRWLLSIYIESPTLKLHSDIKRFEVINIL
jgi:hypothetical protein